MRGEVPKVRWTVGETNDFGGIRWKNLRFQELLLSHKMVCLRRSRVRHFVTLFLSRDWNL